MKRYACCVPPSKTGSTTFDVAQYYGPGTVNEVIREALFPYRSDLAIVSKVAARRDDAGAVLSYDEPDQPRIGIEENLATLGLDRLIAVNLRLMDRSRPGHRAAFRTRSLRIPSSLI
jgi:pyridoxine 4-dehydrogenase